MHGSRNAECGTADRTPKSELRTPTFAPTASPSPPFSPPDRLWSGSGFDPDRRGKTAHGRRRDRRPRREVKMPWETDGRRWHTVDRVGRDGSACDWDGRILDAIERRIHELGDFSPTNWNARTIVEIAATKKVGRLVLSRHHRRNASAADEISHGEEDVQTRPNCLRTEPEAVERNARRARSTATGRG